MITKEIDTITEKDPMKEIEAKEIIKGIGEIIKDKDQNKNKDLIKDKDRNKKIKKETKKDKSKKITKMMKRVEGIEIKEIGMITESNKNMTKKTKAIIMEITVGKID